MKESRNILGWIGIKQEELVLADARRHVDATYETVEWFRKAVSAYISGDAQGKKEAIEKVRKCERDADGIRSKMVDVLSRGILVPPDREDIMHFVKSLDRIADWTNGAARLLDFITKRPSQPILDELSKAADIILDSISKLKDGIQAVMNNELDRAITDCNEVESYETQADDQKKVLTELVIKTEMDAPMLLLLFHLAEYMEGVTDKIEDAADFIKVLAVKSK